MSELLIDRIVKALTASGVKVLNEPVTAAQRAHRNNERKAEVVAGHFNQVDGVKVAGNLDYQCKSCKKRFGDPAIDTGIFIPDFRLCEDCLVDNEFE